MSYKSRAREAQPETTERIGYTPELMCCAHGCPNRWSVDPPRACSAHAWASAHEWPRITQEQLEADASRLEAARQPKESQRFIKPDPAKLHRYLAAMSKGISAAQVNPKAWAEKLREREESAGERLTMAQKEAWRAVCGDHS